MTAWKGWLSSFQALFWVMDPAYPPTVGTHMSAVSLIYTDGDGQIDSGTNDTIDGVPITHVWIGDAVTCRLPDGTESTVKGATFYAGNGPGWGGQVYFVPVDGTELQDATFVSSSWVTEASAFTITTVELPGTPVAPPCLTPGTLVATPGRRGRCGGAARRRPRDPAGRGCRWPRSPPLRGCGRCGSCPGHWAQACPPARSPSRRSTGYCCAPPLPGA